jgi:DNA repair exonuclease SbcCD nuclease subunit
VFGEVESSRLRNATREAMKNLVDLALREQVAFVVLAGDLFDNANPSIGATLFFVSELRRLCAAKIPVYVLRGNHDYDSREGRRLWPDGVHEFAADAPQTFIVPGHRVALHGQSYPAQAVATDMTPQYPAPVVDHLNVGVLHTALEGYSGEHARYAPSTPNTLAGKGYAYWALGHVHDFKHLSVQGAHLVYPGNLQGRHVRETGAKGVALVTWEGARIVDVEHRTLDVVRWHDLTVEIDEPAEAAASAEVRIFKAIAAQVADATREDGVCDRLSAVRIRLAGLPAECLAMGGLRLREQIAASVAAQAGDHVAIEEIRIESTTRLELPAVLEQHVARAKTNLATLGAAPADDPLREFTAKLWQQLDLLGGEARSRVEAALQIKSEADLRAKMIELGAERLVARIGGGR